MHAKLAEIRRVVEQARSMPMSASAVVNRAELLELLDELKNGWADAFSRRRPGPSASATTSSTRAAARRSGSSRTPATSATGSSPTPSCYRGAQRRADEVLAQARGRGGRAAQGDRRVRRRQAGQLRDHPGAHARGRAPRPGAARRAHRPRLADRATRSTRSSCPSTSRAERHRRRPFWPRSRPDGSLGAVRHARRRCANPGRRERTVICCAVDESELTVRLDPRAPLVLDTRELGRRPGSQRR